MHTYQTKGASIVWKKWFELARVQNLHIKTERLPLEIMLSFLFVWENNFLYFKHVGFLDLLWKTYHVLLT